MKKTYLQRSLSMILPGLIPLFAVLAPSAASAENYLLDGGQESQIRYEMTQKISPKSATRKVTLSYVLPRSFASPTYQQRIDDLDLRFSPTPSDRVERADKRGNKVLEVTWNTLSAPISATLTLTAVNSVKLDALTTRAEFPLNGLPEEAQPYLVTTEQVQATDPGIRDRARQLTASARTEFDAVQQILTWVVDHMNYILTPLKYDAVYSLASGKGNCQNYSHLSAALMRSVGIPVRIVNGVTLKKAYDIKLGENILTMKMAQGRHSWIEVFFPDLGWVPFDPQGTELFVSNRFLRIEVGLDNKETAKDGLLRWTQLKGSNGEPGFEEGIHPQFESDRVDLLARKTGYGPRELLLCPSVDARFSKISTPPRPPLPPSIPDGQLKTLQFLDSYVFGNLDFPEGIDFLSSRKASETTAEGVGELRKNFLVETAEYVTTRGQQYAQTFILDRPLKLTRVGLALHRFNDDGQLWVEVFRDRNGAPGEVMAASDILMLDEIPFRPGYAWVDFDFTRSPVLLSPGRYWIALGFTGSPVVNWFFSYGKPVGPQDGTRYRVIFDEGWSRSLAFEFNYRIGGLAARSR